MAELGKHKLSDVVPAQQPITGDDKGGKPEPTPETTAEQVGEEHESQQARATEASIRDRMVNIGRGNQQAGRQGQ